MTRYTKRVREEAALICAIAASTPEFAESYRPVVVALGLRPSPGEFEPESEKLAFDAWRKCQYADHPDAEAASLILDGWSPGDPL